MNLCLTANQFPDWNQLQSQKLLPEIRSSSDFLIDVFEHYKDLVETNNNRKPTRAKL